MLVSSPRRDAVVARLAGRIVGLDRGRRARVAVDGVDGAGKSTLADELASRVEAQGRAVVRASVDSFHRPRVHRYRLGRTSAEGFYRDSYDYDRLNEVLVRPFSPGGSGRYRAAMFDHVTDLPVTAPEQRADPDAVLILDGIFLHRPELDGSWDFSIFLQVGFGVSLSRCASRGGMSDDPHAPSNRRYVDGQRLYLREARPWERATVVVDNTDLAAPVIVEPAGSALAGIGQ
jgi:uridine kinase